MIPPGYTARYRFRHIDGAGRRSHTGPVLARVRSATLSGVEAATILDGRVPHALLLEIFTEAGVGTMVTRN